MPDKISRKISDVRPKTTGARRTSRPRWIIAAVVYFAALTGLGLVGGAFLNGASAANWSGPAASPPLGNIPLPVWNRLDTTKKQENTAVDIDGYVAAGSVNLDLGAAAGGQNLYYGFAPYDQMHSANPAVAGDKSDYLLQLETEKDNVWTSRLNVDRDGNLALAGNLDLANNQAVRVNGPGTTGLNVGNWGAGASGFKLGLFGELCLSDGTACRSDWPIGLPDASAGQTLRFDGESWLSSSYIFNNEANVGINTADPRFILDVRNGVGAAVVSVNDKKSVAGEPQLWTGYRVSRGPGSDGSGTEKWFLGVNDTDDKLRIRSGGGNDNLVIDGTGRVGIGTTNPGHQLDVQGGDGIIGVGQALRGNSTLFIDTALTTGGDINLRPQVNQAMVIKVGGNVGIGTTTPGAKLDVNGLVQVAGFKMPTGAQDTYVLTSDAAGTGTWQTRPIGLPASAANGDTLRYDGTASSWIANHLLANDGQAVGIGVTLPDAPGWPLDVRSSSGTAMSSLDDRNGSLWTGLRLARKTGADLNREKWFIGLPGDPSTGDSLVFKQKKVDGSDAVRLAVNYDTGFVGIGTLDPAASLDVKGMTLTQGFKMPPAVPLATNYVLTSKDDLGEAEWRKMITADECTGGKFNHLTTLTYDGNRGGYPTANGYCGVSQHVCTSDEILRTIACAPATLADPYWTVGASAWVDNGPPSYTSPAANDCSGWTSNAAGAYGAFWQLSVAGAGRGLVTSCSVKLRFACCKQ